MCRIPESVHVKIIPLLIIIQLCFANKESSQFPTSWNSTNIIFTIPKNYPDRLPIFSLQILLPPPPFSEQYSSDLCERSQTICRSLQKCREKGRKKEELGGERKRKREKREKRLFGNLENNQRRKTKTESNRRKFHSSNVRNLEREEWKEEDQSIKERLKETKRRRDRQVSFGSHKFRLVEDHSDLFLLNVDNKTGLLTLYLSRRLRSEDYVKNHRESFVEVLIQVKEKEECHVDLGSGTPSKDAYNKNKTRDWRKLHSVRLHVAQPFNCMRPSDNLCFLPERNLTLHQWENRDESSLLILPSLTYLCPNLYREMNISMHNVNRRNPVSELLYSDQSGFYTPPLDRENRDSHLSFDFKCTIKNSKGEVVSWKHSSGYLFVEDEDDSLPIRHSKSQHVVLNVTDLLDIKFTNLLYFVDPDLTNANEFIVSTSGDLVDIFNIESLFTFHVQSEDCFKLTKDFPNPLKAACTIMQPFLIPKDKDLPSNRPFNFSVELVDTTLVHNPHGNKVWYNVTINVLNSNHQAAIVLDSSTITNRSIPFPLRKHARIDQAIYPPSNSYIKKLVGPKFTLAPKSQNKGVDTTKDLGILYISEPELFNVSLNTVSPLEIVLLRGSNYSKTFYLSWSKDKYSCDHKLPRPPLVTTNDQYPNACSIHADQDSCVDSCGVGSMQGGCSWRSGKSKFWAEDYSTCSPDLKTCPDGICDELEKLGPKICPQDCVEEDKVKGEIRMNTNLDPPRGIVSGMGVCTCDDFCQCFPVGNFTLIPEGIEGTFQTVNREAIEERCGATCRIVLGFGVVFGFFIVIVVFCRKRKDCGGKFKEGSLAGIHYPSDYIEDHSSSYTSAPQHGEPHVMALYSVHPHDNRANNNNNNINQGSDLPLPNILIDRKWEFPRNQLILEQTLGEGEFGKVMKAKALGIGGSTGYSSVAVKMLKNNRTAADQADLLSEYDLLKEVNHPNVIQLLGACTTKGGPIFLIIEYCKYGSLRTYLRRCRHFEFESRVGSAPLEEPDFDYKICPKDLLSFAWQICKGMAYLSNMKLVHRDLAARNVLLAHEKLCKISDFGLTRDVYEGDLYTKRSKGKVPVKWMALESLVDHVYTSKSDVWSFGVLLWELVTLGSSPYPGIAPERLYPLLKSGYRMERPDNCSEDLYRVIRACWAEDANKRVSFNELMNIFERMIQEDVEYLELRTLIVTNRAYFDERTCEAESSTTLEAMEDCSNGVLSECSPKGSFCEKDETKIDKDSYLLAHSQGSHLPPRQESAVAPLLSTLAPPTTGVNITCHGTSLHAHNLAYSPTSASQLDLLQPIPPPLQYSTLASGPDEEEEVGTNIGDNQDGPSEGDSESGRATGDSGYLTEEGRRSHSKVLCETQPPSKITQNVSFMGPPPTRRSPLGVDEPSNGLTCVDGLQDSGDKEKNLDNDLLINPSKDRFNPQKRLSGVNIVSNDLRNPVVV